MDKKVLIVTMPASDNYGNRLQNYATQQFLTSLGYDCTTLNVDIYGDIRDTSILKERPLYKKLTPGYVWRFLNRNRVKTGRKKEQLYFERCERFARFDQQHVRMTPYQVAVSNYPLQELHEYDFAVCGSDQIWNPTYYYRDLFYLSFMPAHKRVALAPSIGIAHINPQYKPYMRKNIEAIPYLSVREQSGADIIRELTGREAKVLQDPTLWTGADEWRAVAAAPENMPQKPYLLCYFLGKQTKSYRRHIERYANEHGLEIISIADREQPQFYTCGPCEFLHLIDHASLVCTDSFHGVAFSLIFETPFVTFMRTDGAQMSTRISGIMEHVGVNRSQKDVAYSDALRMDFSGVKQTLSQDRAAAVAYLQNAAEQIAAQKPVPLLAEPDYCNGCRACQVSCPVGAIDWRQDEEGFFRPYVAEDKCIKCGKCQSVCPVLGRKPRDEKELPEARAAWALDENIRKNSSSGGLFSVLATEILSRGGVVFGAGFDEHWQVRHRYIESVDQLPLLRTSKYVQSDVGQTYAQAKCFLEQGRWVYYSGTPCQTEGLRAYLGKDYDKLILQDIACHGVPSPKVWESYLDEVSKHAGGIEDVNFRDKSNGWIRFGMRIARKDATVQLTEHDKDAYMRAFLSNLCLRPSCYNCVNKTAKRSCDITLADYWGVANVHPELDVQNGVSLVLVQSEKGQALLDAVADRIWSMQTDCEQALGYNSATQKSVILRRRPRAIFMSQYKSGIKRAVEKALNITLYRKARRLLSRVKRVLKKMLKGSV